MYETIFTSNAPGWLVFQGVSALARVFVNGLLACEHLGIWDAFSVRIEHVGEVSLRVEVTKNGGETIPVSSIASGFLPYVFGTFGGIYKQVEWFEQDEDPLTPSEPAPLRARFDGHKLIVDDKPVYLRGLLHWGWYPGLRHPAPEREICRQEIAAVKAMGFNCVKFCLWVPPHHYLEELESAEMFAWMELPIWNPGANTQQFHSELESIVTQYRHHRSIILWTVGCELGHQMTREARRALFYRVKELTGGGLVKDSSGGAEMYGGDPIEFGDFEDFHPYCDLSQFPAVLDLLQAGPRLGKAVLLGECNDFDNHRNLPRMVDEQPYWATDDSFLNAQGVRWQYDLPGVLANSRFATDSNAHRALMSTSLSMKLFVHRTFQEWMRGRTFAGNVITGIADTPISGSGLFDDWGEAKFPVDEIKRFMGPDTFFLIPQRRLPWVDGGNRVASYDPWHVFEGHNRIRIGMHSEAGYEGLIRWSISGGGFKASGEATACVIPLEPTEVADITWDAPPDARLTLRVEASDAWQCWPIESVSRWSAEEAEFALPDPGSVVSAPAFREAAYEFRHPALSTLFDHRPHTLLQALTDRFLDPAALPSDADILGTRVDTRTYRELPVVAKFADSLVSTLRSGNDPAGLLVLRALRKL